MKHNQDHNAKKKKGQAAKYITRNGAIKFCQIPLKSFRRLCVLKGIYPRKPNSYRKVQGGDPTERILYLRDDIRSLLDDPAVWAIREQKHYLRNLNKYKRKAEPKKVRALVRRKPIINVDHMILERYPTFTHALQDLDDPLCSIFFTAVLSASKIHPSAVVNKCRRLAVEFMHFVIEARALRKVFITMKGYYYRAEIQGIDITWVTPHPFPIKDDPHIDQKILQHANEFYVRFMSFVNYKLYQSINICYPPRIQSYMDRIKALRNGKSVNAAKTKKKIVQAKSNMKNSILALSVPIIDKKRTKDTDQYEPDLLKAHFGCKANEAKEVLEKTEKQKSIFEGLKFYLNMETNRESLTFVIRSGGGEVSWDYSLGQGHRYPESDMTITHQIVDRPTWDKKYLNRYYVQPQWVYDSFNHALRLPMQDYFVGATLPPHLSPFEETYNDYVPPELKKIQVLQQECDSIDFESLNAADRDFNPKAISVEQILGKDQVAVKKVKTPTTDSGPLAKMATNRGKVIKRDLKAEQKKEDDTTKKFAESLIHKRQKKLYQKLVEVEEDRKRKGENLAKSRALFEGFKKGKLDKMVGDAQEATAQSATKKKKLSSDSSEVKLLKGKRNIKTKRTKFYKQKPQWNR